MSIAIFLAFVAFVLGLSWFLGRRAKTSAGYFAAHGQVGWFVNGIAFAGDYLSAASFLGICGMIAFYGYDGFLYSIGFLAGWVVALFVIAEPIKRLGKFTFADALAAKFDNSRGITLAAAISTLVVSVFYLIPQMVGAGSLIKPLLGFPHWVGVILVGGIVITIVTTAGMVSTTWVQFIKGSLLVVFCAVLVVMILNRGQTKNLTEDRSGWIDAPIADYLAARRLTPLNTIQQKSSEPIYFSGPNADGKESIFRIQDASHGFQINEAQIVPDGSDKQLRPSGMIERLEGDATATGSVGPRWFLVQLSRATIINAVSEKLVLTDGTSATGYYQQDRQGEQLLLPGGYFKGIRSPNLLDRLDFASLMLALFCGTAALPHILIRYYTVKDASAARKSTVVGICAIGFFYILTLYIGLGAMVSGNLDPTDSNMSA
ncbi:MAG TPA: cation acetate symporter, partial [Tepidisphaeraceae bacterium]